jgi:hypothetical protein
MLKRLNDRQSFYDHRGWEKDHEKSQKYKKNICVFPSINFNTNKNENENFGRATFTSYKSKSSSLYNKLKMTNFNFKSGSNTGEDFYQVSNIKSPNNTGDKKILFNKKVFLGDLSHCVVTFSVQNKQ